ncbi:MAG: anthranilate phosphoribosyltransferase [Candidatus Omnitrophota bacterium]
MVTDNLSIYTDKLVNKIDLSSEDAARAMRIIMSTQALESDKAAFLTALARKDATTREIASFALTIRQIAKQVELKNFNKDKIFADTCGTGGGAVETFNISTAIMFILSASGIVVAKHGNRAITSKCGSADVLEELGININMEPERVVRCLSEIDIAFLFAPFYHVAFKNVQKVRREIGAPTVFNILGPLVNPVFSPAYKQGIKTVQVLGVREEGLIKKLAQVLKILNLHRAMVAYGKGPAGRFGMDEISTLGDTMICELMEDGQIKEYKINPQDFGIKLAKPDDLGGGTAKQNAQILLDILSGKEKGPKRDIVLLNASAGLYLGKKARDLHEGIKLAGECIDSGKALERLGLLRRFSQEKD